MKCMKASFEFTMAHMGIAIGGADIDMAKHILDESQIGAIFE